MDQIPYQDLTVMETQGVVSDRTAWRMGTSDYGVALFHELLLREMARVERGLNPLGVARGPDDATPVLWEPKGHVRGGSGIRMFPVESPLGRG
jgi:hypothetical protein